MIDKATVKRILDTADIVEVVGDYVNLGDLEKQKQETL